MDARMKSAPDGPMGGSGPVLQDASEARVDVASARLWLLANLSPQHVVITRSGPPHKQAALWRNPPVFESASALPRAAPVASRAASAAATASAALAAEGPTERAQAAFVRGDLRAAQLEYRNAVRAAPDLIEPRVGLARSSLELGDGETAEVAAKAAMERGYDRVAGTALVLRSQLMRNRLEELLRDFPLREGQDPAPVAGQVAAARAVAQLALGRRDDAQRSVAAAVRLAPDAVEPQLAAVALALAAGDRAAATAAVDRALTIDPDNAEAQLRRSALLLTQPDVPGGLAVLDRLVERSPGSMAARLRRAEVLIQLNQMSRARADVDAVLAALPNSAPATYLRAMLLVRAQDWRGRRGAAASRPTGRCILRRSAAAGGHQACSRPSSAGVRRGAARCRASAGRRPRRAPACPA